jgi:CRISP-associated protein Cas1
VLELLDEAGLLAGNDRIGQRGAVPFAAAPLPISNRRRAQLRILPLRKLLNTLYVTVPHAYLSKDRGDRARPREQETLLRVPVHTLEGIVCVGLVSISPALMGFCAESRVGVSFLTEQGRFLGRLQGPIHETFCCAGSNIAGLTTNPPSAALARAYLLAKVANCRTSMLRAAREHPSPTLDAACLQLGQSLCLLERSATLGGLRGVEGDAARTTLASSRS